MENLDPALIAGLKKESLRYVSDTIPGYFRQKNRGAFSYYDTKGKKITDEKTITRIRELVIPPAWEDVWIAPHHNAHLQATGIDEKGRKQYLYHVDWKKISQENKFSKMIDFGLNLPKIRSKISYDMQAKDMSKQKILSTIVWLLEHTFVRIGNEEYKKENNSYGLTTLRNKHAQIKQGEIVFRFRGKHGVENIIEVSNPTVIKTIKKCIELPGYELFQYIDGKGERHIIDSQDVNDFLQDITQNDFTAKDFRTWGATTLSSELLYKKGQAENPVDMKKNIVETVKKVAEHLNNTVAVCRSYYIHPTVIKTYSKKVLIPHFESHKNKKPKIKGLSWDEEALINLLKRYS